MQCSLFIVSYGFKWIMTPRAILFILTSLERSLLPLKLFVDARPDDVILALCGIHSKHCIIGSFHLIVRACCQFYGN